MSTDSDYRRSSRGDVVHRSGCRHIQGRGSAWPYADGFTADDILHTLATAPWLIPCRTCRPEAS